MHIVVNAADPFRGREDQKARSPPPPDVHLVLTPGKKLAGEQG